MAGFDVCIYGAKDFQNLQREALLANPLLEIDRVLVVNRMPQQPSYPCLSLLAADL
jgi:hypothetical protein